MKKALIIAGSVIVFLLLAVLVIPGLLNWNHYKAQIENAVEAATGRDVTIDGDIALSLLPAPAFSVEQVKVANLPDGAAEHMLTLGTLDVRVALFPLLRGNFDVEKLVLIGARLNLEVLPDGRRNWDFNRAPEEEIREQSGVAANVRLNRFVVEDGVVDYRDGVTGFSERVENIDALISAESLNGPFRVEGTLAARRTPLSIAATVGQFGNGKVPVSLDLGLSAASAKAAFRGLVNPGEQPGAEGTLKIEGRDLGALVGAVARLSGDAAGTDFTPPAIARPVVMEAAFVAEQSDFRTTALTYSLGSSRGDGRIMFNWADAPRFDVKLGFATLDMDELMPTDAAQRESGKEKEGDGFTLPDPGQFLPENMSGALALSAEAVRYREGVVRQARLSARAEDGAVDVEEVHALLPGGGELTLKGRIAETRGEGRFDGTLDLAANNLRGVLAWLDMEPEGFEAGTLSTFGIDGDVYLTARDAGVAKAVVRLDTATFRGDASFAPGPSPGGTPKVRMAGVLDRLDLAAYMPKGTKCFEPRGDEPGSDPLTVADAEFNLTVDRLSCPETRFEALVMDGAIADGVLSLNKFTADNALGLKVAASGTLSNLADTPAFDLDLEANGSSLREVEQLFPDVLPRPATDLGALSFKGALSGTTQDITVSGALGLGGTTVNGRAAVAFDPDAGNGEGGIAVLRTIDGDVRLEASSLAQFISQWDLPLTPPPSRDDRRVEVGGTVKGSASAVDVDLDGLVADARFTAKGQLQGLSDATTYAVDVVLDGSDLRGFLRGIGMDFRPADPSLGPIKIQASLAGGAESLSVTIPSGQAGPVVFNGATTVNYAGERPMIAGDFRAGSVPLDRFMTPSPEDAKAQHEWSDQPFNNDWLKAFDANFMVRADSVTLNRYRFDQPRFTLGVSNGALEIRDLTGKLFDGDVKLAMRYGGADVPGLGLEIALSNASLEKAMQTAFGLSAMTGTLGFTSEISGSGVSPRALVRTLRGQSRLTLGEGEVRGIDLPRLTSAIGSTNNLDGFARILGTALSGGKTMHKGFDAPISTEDGTFTMADKVIELDSGRALLGGRVDLVEWQINGKGRMQLADHPSAPPIGVDIKGLLNQPSVNYQTRELQSFVAAEISKAVLQRATGGGLDQLLGRPRQDGDAGTAAPEDSEADPATGDQPEQETQQQPEQNKDPTRQLLEGIFKNLERQDEGR